ncbi:MAG: radical SAM protein [Rhodospirillaceae bacterium]|nr:radical SAM protein [Rhodospirillaceae bacterium]MBT5242873.1 radical SAM protein [Rhodospirillaceae bacterium]MBT5563097.1 radical SAM protein [Rhodospirillaceae bacterium]MBT6243412.1 radical SAM protein [Rhodospirillaceae bacterium]MBT7138517.1 radical SAM protein [Rhodospirillaceae bacterium]
MPDDVKKRIYLNEYNVLLDGTTYLPLVSGLLQAHAELSEKIRETCLFRPYLFHLDASANIIKQYEDPFVAAFSMSMWNEQLSLHVAREVKRRFPECKIVVGGAQVPHSPETFFDQYPFIDIAVRGEGEEAFTEILERLVDGEDLAGLAGVSWRDSNGEFINNSTDRPFNRDLDTYPSPYVSGLFDDLIDTRDDLTFQAIVETNRGCPFLCTFCYWGKGGLSRKYRYHSLNRVNQEIEWMGKRGIQYVFNADSNFGMHRRDMEIAKFLAETKNKYGFPEKFRTCYGKNTDEKILEIGSFMHSHGLEKGITISYQSMSEQVQKNIKRDNIRIDVAKSLQVKFGDKGIPIYTELILGLPGETVASWIGGVDEVLSSGFSNQLFIYSCLVFPNTDLGDSDYQKEFGIVTQRIEAAEIHAKKRPADWQPEFEDIVVTTNTMSKDDWRHLMVFSWITMLLHSLKLGYFILGYLFNRLGCRHSELISCISEARFDQDACPIWSDQVAALYNQADKFFDGEGRGVFLPEHGDIYWDVEEACFLNLSADLDSFYSETLDICRSFLQSSGKTFDNDELSQVVDYQQMRIPTMMLPEKSAKLFSLNIPEYFQKLFGPNPVPLKASPQQLTLEPENFENDKRLYARKTILWGRKSDLILVPAEYCSVEQY